MFRSNSRDTAATYNNFVGDSSTSTIPIVREKHIEMNVHSSQQFYLDFWKNFRKYASFTSKDPVKDMGQLWKINSCERTKSWWWKCSFRIRFRPKSTKQRESINKSRQYRANCIFGSLFLNFAKVDFQDQRRQRIVYYELTQRFWPPLDQRWTNLDGCAWIAVAAARTIYHTILYTPNFIFKLSEK